MNIKNLIKQYKSIKPDASWEHDSYETLLRYFQNTFPKKSIFNLNFYTFIIRPVAVSLLALIFILSGSFGAVMMAKNSLPGEWLYPVKRVGERVRMIVALNQAQKTVLRAEILTNRVSETKVLAKKAEAGDKESEQKLNDLAKSFVSELEIFKKELSEQIPKKQITPFPDSDLLKTDLADQGSLPIQDGQQIFSVLPTEDLEKILTETKSLLAEKNLSLALTRAQEMTKIVQEKETAKQESIEPEEKDLPVIEPVEPKAEPLVPEIKPIIKNIKNIDGSVGKILETKSVDKSVDKSKQEFKVRIEKDVPAQTGMIREK